MKRIMGFIVVMVILLTLVMTGCQETGSNTDGDTKETAKKETEEGSKANDSVAESNVNPAGEFPIVNEKVTLSAFVVQAQQVEDMETNEATIALEELTNIELDLVIAQAGSQTEKRNLLLASGDYPEIFVLGQFNNTDIMTYGVQEGIFQPLNDLIDEYGPNIKKAWDEIPGLQAAMTAPDGNIYGIPNINFCYHCSMAQKMYMNFEWLEAVGMDAPQTTDDFYKVLKAFKEQDVNGNGDPNDEIPLSGTPQGWYGEIQHFIMNAFIYDDGKTFFQVKDGSLDFVADKNEWREGLRYMNMLYEEGLIDPASFTQANDQVKQLAANDLMGASPAGVRNMFVNVSAEDDSYKNWQLISPLEGPSGLRVAPVFPGVEYGAHFTITDKCENPEAAIRLADFWYSEAGTLLMDKGVEGSGWVKAKEGDMNLLGEQAKFESMDYPGETTQNRNWNQWCLLYRGSELGGYRGAFVSGQDPDAPEGTEKHLFDGTKDLYEPYAAEEFFTAIFVQPENIDELAQIEVSLVDYIKQSMVLFIIGDLDVDGGDWDNYLQELKDLGADHYVELYNQGWN